QLAGHCWRRRCCSRLTHRVREMRPLLAPLARSDRRRRALFTLRTGGREHGRRRMTALFTRNRLLGLAAAAAIFLADQWVKWLVAGPLGLTQEGDHLDLLPFFDFTRTHNLGVSLGMLTATSLEMRWGLVAMTSLIALIVLVWLFREKRFG